MRLLKSSLSALLVMGSLLAFSGNSGATPIVGGTTSVALDSATITALTGLGFSIAPVAPSTLTGLTAAFPITGGDTSTSIFHSGGLAFTKGGTTLDLTNYTINLTNDILYATANGGSTQIAFLDLGNGGVLTLDPVAAGALVSIFSIPNLSGADIGTATVNATLAPEPASAALLAGSAGLLAMMLLRKRKALN